MSEIIDNLKADLKTVQIDHEEERMIPLIHAEIMLENTRQLTRIADCFEKLISKEQTLNVDARVQNFE